MIVLPKTYLNDSSGRYPQHVGKPKISYSQYSSFKSEEYRDDYISHYIFGGPRTSNIYAEYGSACGQYFEDLSIDKAWLSADDLETLANLERPSNAKYEVEIVVDMGTYVIQGFIDQEYLVEEGLVLKDLKTGNVNTKVSYYGGEDYQQTTVYAHARHLEGESLHYCGVTLLGRKGDGQRWGQLRLSGDIREIPTPYSLERAEKALHSITEVTTEISDIYKVFLKMKKW